MFISQLIRGWESIISFNEKLISHNLINDINDECEVKKKWKFFHVSIIFSRVRVVMETRDIMYSEGTMATR